MPLSDSDPTPVVLLTQKKKAHGDRRSTRRRPCDERVSVWRGCSNTPIEPTRGWALNISEGGLRLIVNSELEVDEPLGIELESEKLACGRVIWVSQQSDGCVVGVAFS